MKNFKKVISAVIALAMIISSFTAVSASKFADVADTANYAEAVEVLAALGIVNGTEEEGALVFKPENQVTRAEAATMIVGALNMSDDAKASAGTSQFADVNTQAAWAAGYVNVGVAQGFIKGYDASTFGPLDNVTYAQMCVMLTSIAGYGEYAAANGGWPTGYTNMAAATGMNKGVAVAADAALTKGQVAQMVYNTLVTPKLGVAEYALTGNTYSQLDGKNGRDYQTLLSEKFEGYVATVTITATPASNADELENDEVAFTVTKCDWWPEVESNIAKEADWEATDSLFAEGVDVNGNHLQSGKAAFITNEDDELVMVYFASTGKTATKELAADTYYPQAKLSDSNQFGITEDEDENEIKNAKLRFGSTYYKMAESIAIYVNGTNYTTVTLSADAEDGLNASQATLDKIVGGATGTVKLVKANDADYYNTIYVDYYQVAKVVDVDVDDDETRVLLSDVKALINDSYDYDEIVISTEAVEEGDVIVTVAKNGAKAELADLKKDDIIAYAVNFTGLTNLEDPAKIDIIATNDTASGSVTKVDWKNDKYTIGGNVYGLVDVAADADDVPFALKDSLVLTLDPFGRIFDIDTDGTSKKYAVIIKESTNEDQVTLLLADGTTKTFDVTAAVETVLGGVDVAARTAAERIVTYTVKGSTGEISALTFISEESDVAEYTYKARTNKLGVNTITATTPIIDATKAEDAAKARKAGNYATMSKDNLVDGSDYDAIVVKDGTYVAFVLVTEVGTAFGETSRFAVVKGEPVEHYTDDDDACWAVPVLYEGKDTEELLFAYGAFDEVGTDDLTLEVGDAFFFETDSDGFIDTVYVVYSAGDEEATNLPADLVGTGADAWSVGLVAGIETVQLTTAAIVDVKADYITFADLADVNDNGIINTNNDLEDEEAHGIVTYTYASDLAVYVYDINNEDVADEEDKFKARNSYSAIKASNIGRYEHPDNDGVFGYEADARGEGEEDDLEANLIDMARVNEAFAMIVDGDIVAIYVIQK